MGFLSSKLVLSKLVTDKEKTTAMNIFPSGDIPFQIKYTQQIKLFVCMIFFLFMDLFMQNFIAQNKDPIKF